MPVPNLESHLVMARLKGWATVIEWRCPRCHLEFILPLSGKPPVPPYLLQILDGGVLTSILIQTDDATPQVLIPAAVGVVSYVGISIQCPKCLKAGVNANKIHLINRGRTSKLTKHGWIPEETKEEVKDEN